VAAAFYRSKMSEKVVSLGVIEYLEQHPERIWEIRKHFDDSVYDIKHNLRHCRIADLQKELGSLREAVKAKEALNVKLGNQNKLAQREAARLKEEVASLKRSTAYRTGMFLTWPFRKLYRGLFRRS
jgi:hypothetical protein